MPSTMTEADGRSKKALLVAVVLVMIAGAGGWFAFNRRAATPATLLAAPLSQAERKPVAPTSAATPTAAASAGTSAPVAATAAPGRLTDGAGAKSATKQKPALGRDSLPRLEADLAAPTIPASVDVDAVTRGIEQSTKAKVDSAEKPRIDVKPIFKKP
jgi:hypothetical protein